MLVDYMNLSVVINGSGSESKSLRMFAMVYRWG